LSSCLCDNDASHHPILPILFQLCIRQNYYKHFIVEDVKIR
jgi:hypothetical protein